MAIPFAVLELGSTSDTPFKRGFYCDDETIRYPYRSDTISDPVLVVVCLLPNVVAVSKMGKYLGGEGRGGEGWGGEGRGGEGGGILTDIGRWYGYTEMKKTI